MSKPFGLGVKAVVRDEQGRILLIRRAPKSKYFRCQWELPGGKLDPGEAFDAGLLREVAEETGLEVELTGAAGAFEFPLPAVRVVILVMEARLTAGQVRLSDEHDDFAWVARDAVCGLDLSDQLRVFLEDYCRR